MRGHTKMLDDFHGSDTAPDHQCCPDQRINHKGSGAEFFAAFKHIKRHEAQDKAGWYNPQAAMRAIGEMLDIRGLRSWSLVHSRRNTDAQWTR